MTKIGFTGTGYAVCLAMASALVGCGGATSGESPDGSSTADGPQSSAPQAIIKNDDGREYLRVDLWDPADLALIMEQAAPHEGPETAESLAANLRGQMLTNDHWYIEREAPIELARKILRGEAIQETPELDPQEGRRIIGNDDRVHTAIGFNQTPNTWIGFSQIGCTANLIGRRSAVTAAHCVYNTFDTAFTQGWYCDNGTVGGGTNASRGPNQGVCGSNRVYAQWRFGVEDSYGYTGWFGAGGCARLTIPTGYINNIQNAHQSSSQGIWTLSRWDYAAISLTGCTSQTSHYGTAILTDQELLDASAQDWGYPQNAPCPANVNDCSNNRYVGTSAPFGGAEIWGAGGSNIQRGHCTVSTAPGSLCPAAVEAHTIGGDIDVTGGDSGSAIYRTVNGVRQLFGTLTGTDGTTNIWHRWNTETSNFVDANTEFPSDP
ncbi:MAG TPA: hypothetical protein VG937_06625 [Polyangiaceae bacterium]|nr:hypothetical protein [Polyangiaceae bacterium]